MKRDHYITALERARVAWMLRLVIRWRVRRLRDSLRALGWS